MSVLGNRPTKEFTDIVTDYFQGDGISTSFMLSRTPPNQSGLDVSIEGITQPANRFSINNNMITFVASPPITEPESIAIVHRYGIPLNIGQVPQDSVLRGNIGNGAIGPNQLTDDFNELEIIANKFRVKQNTPNAVFRKLVDKVKDTINVKDYGIIGNGVADDTNFLVNAIEDCQGKTIIIDCPIRVKRPSTINFTETMGVIFLPKGKLIADFCALHYVEVQDKGSGYVTIPTLQVVPSDLNGQGASVRARMEVEDITIANVGGNYTIGNIISITGGVFEESIKIKITALGSGGSISGFEVINRGIYMVLPTSPVIGTTNGSGTNGSFSITSWRVHDNEILSPGADYTAMPSLVYHGGGGTGASSLCYGTPLGFDANLIAGDYEIFDTNTRGGNYQGHFGYSDVSAKWFGAKGDNITDDTKSLQIALDCSNNVNIPKGNYLISKPLKLRQEYHNIKGYGKIITKINFNGTTIIQNYLPNTNIISTLDTGLNFNNSKINIEGLSFEIQTSANNNISVISLADYEKLSIENCLIKDISVLLNSGTKNAIISNNRISSTSKLILKNNTILGNYSNIIVDITGSEIVIEDCSIKSGILEVLKIINSSNVILENNIFDGLNIAINPEGAVVLQNCLNGTIRNTRILNSGSQKLFPAIYFKGIGSATRNYVVEQCRFGGDGFTGNFDITIQDDNTNSIVAGVIDELIRYNRYEIITPQTQVYGRGQLLGGTNIGGFNAMLPVASTFSNSVPLLLGYQLDTGNHSVEVLISGRALVSGLPFAAKVLLMNSDNGIGNHPADAHILYSYNSPGLLGLAYDGNHKQFTLTLDTGTILDVSATITGNGVYTSSFGQ